MSFIEKKTYSKIRISLLGLVAVILGLMLVACGENPGGNSVTATPAPTTTQPSVQPTTVPATATSQPTILPATSQPQPTTALATTKAPVPTATPVKTSVPAPTAVSTVTEKTQPTPTKNVSAYNPVLDAAPQKQVKLGSDLTLNGSGYPANLKLKVVGGVQNTNEQYGNVVTDAQGRFSLSIHLPLTGIYPGEYYVYAASEDYKIQAKVQLEVYAALTPVLETSKEQVSRGDEITLNGRGYPANTDLQVVAGVQNPVENFGTVRTDAQGNFQLRVKLALPSLVPGPYYIYASTEDFVYQANVQVTVKG